MSRRKRWLWYGGTFCAAFVAQAAFLWSILSPSPAVRDPPLEQNRVTHPDGFSIVRPGRTRASLDEHGIHILPDGGRSRYTAVFGARRLPGPPDPAALSRDGYQPGKFQNRDAYVSTQPSGQYRAWRAVTSRGGRWYEIHLLLPGGDVPGATKPPAEWQQYLNTFAAPE